jgi:hypothetical protein
VLHGDTRAYTPNRIPLPPASTVAGAGLRHRKPLLGGLFDEAIPKRVVRSIVHSAQSVIAIGVVFALVLK